MASENPDQKRKPGRFPAASKIAETASGQPPGPGQSAETSAPLRKRGRQRKSVDSATQNGESPSANSAGQSGPVKTGQKKRGRPPKARDAEHEEESPSEVRPAKRRRADEAAETEDGQGEGEESSTRHESGQDSGNGTPEIANLEKQSTADIASRSKRRSRHFDNSPARSSPPERQAVVGPSEKANGRQGRKPAGSDEQPAEDRTVEESSTRRSQRERRSADDKPWWAAQASPPAGPDKQAPGVPKPKRGRPSLAELSVSKAQNKVSPSQTEAGKKKPRGRPPRASNEAGTSKQDDAQAPSSKPPNPSRKRSNRRPFTEAEPSPPTEPPRVPDHFPNNHHHLITLTQHIPRATIASRWTPLDAPSITAVTNSLTDASLPILHRLRDRDARHAQAQSILRTFATRLRAKLIKGMPFPPASIAPTSSSSNGRGRGKSKSKGGSHEVELDFEKTVDAIAGLEKALDPLLHSVVLLKAEKEREERALEREYEVLRRLEENARAQVRGWREGMARGREHVLLGGIGSSHLEGRVGGGEFVAAAAAAAAASSFGEGGGGGI